jgi:hypothetical protein
MKRGAVEPVNKVKILPDQYLLDNGVFFFHYWGGTFGSVLLYSPRWYVTVIVEKLVEWRSAGETEVLWENLPQRHFVHHKSHMIRPGF